MVFFMAQLGIFPQAHRSENHPMYKHTLQDDMKKLF